jgi:hypothetical protein
VWEVTEAGYAPPPSYGQAPPRPGPYPPGTRQTCRLENSHRSLLSYLPVSQR